MALDSWTLIENQAPINDIAVTLAKLVRHQ
jgi:hypothetical protein